MKKIFLADLLKGVLSEFENQVPAVQADDLRPNLSIKVDPEQIKTVFKNIVSNAVKYSSSDSEPIRINVKSRPPHIVVRIIDNGIGIPRDELRFVFEPFYRVDKSRTKDTGGYGLGLSLCKTIMEAHGGRIEVESEPGAGTTVTLFFPDK